MSDVPPEPPLALLAELTHRCPLGCPYCSNPLELERAGAELDTATWCRVLDEAAALGVLQVHFSGGEPLVRRDLADIVARAAEVGLYGNLITSGIGLDRARVAALQRAGLEHVQLSLQDTDELAGDRIAHRPGAQAEKRRAAEAVRDAGLPLTLNAVVHRQNLARLDAMIELAVALGAERLEIAHVQYYGWALREPRRAAADPRAAERRDANGRGRPRPARRDFGHRLCRAGLLREPAEGLHGGLGPALPERHPLGQGAALPCRRNPAGPGISDRHRGKPGGDLEPLRGVRAFPRHGMDARTLPLLRARARSIGAAAAARLSR